MVHAINTITVPDGMEAQAEPVRVEQVRRFRNPGGFAGVNACKSLQRSTDGSIQCVNVVVNKGFQDANGKNSGGTARVGQWLPRTHCGFAGALPRARFDPHTNVDRHHC